MDAIERRDILKPAANPGAARDYVVMLTGERVLLGAQVHVILRYVPDRHVLPPATFQSYLDRIGELEWASLEAAAVAILDDMSNELLGRWTQVTLRAPGSDSAGGQEIAIEDHQPGWHNEDLLYRLPPV